MGGEPLRWNLVDEIQSRSNCRIINHYGPTEATVGSLTFEFDASQSRYRPLASVPIGRPLPGESAWVLNVRADPKVKLGKTSYVATEVPVEKRAPIIAVYRPLAGKVVEGYWKQLPDDADHPIFALTPA